MLGCNYQHSKYSYLRACIYHTDGSLQLRCEPLFLGITESNVSLHFGLWFMMEKN